MLHYHSLEENQQSWLTWRKARSRHEWTDCLWPEKRRCPFQPGVWRSTPPALSFQNTSCNIEYLLHGLFFIASENYIEEWTYLLTYLLIM